MLIPESWLRTLANPSMTTAELAHLLTMSGLEVESCTPVAPPFTGIVVGEVLTVAKHPNADKLSLCSVNAGQGEPNLGACMPTPRSHGSLFVSFVEKALD